MIWELRSWSPIMDFVTSILYSTCICRDKMWMETTKENMGAFHSTKKSGLNFGNFQERVEQHFPKFPKREEPGEVYPNFGKFFPGSFLSIQLFSRNFKNFPLNGSHFANSTVSKTSPGNFYSIRKFWWMTRTGNTLSGSETSRRCFDSDRPVSAEKKLGSSPCDKRTAQWPFLTGGNTTVVTTMFYSRYVSWRYGSELTGTSSWSSWTSV